MQVPFAQPHANAHMHIRRQCETRAKGKWVERWAARALERNLLLRDLAAWRVAAVTLRRFRGVAQGVMMSTCVCSLSSRTHTYTRECMHTRAHQAAGDVEEK